MNESCEYCGKDECDCQAEIDAIEEAHARLLADTIAFERAEALRDDEWKERRRGIV